MQWLKYCDAWYLSALIHPVQSNNISKLNNPNKMSSVLNQTKMRLNLSSVMQKTTSNLCMLKWNRAQNVLTLMTYHIIDISQYCSDINIFTSQGISFSLVFLFWGICQCPPFEAPFFRLKASIWVSWENQKHIHPTLSGHCQTEIIHIDAVLKLNTST